MPQFDGSYTRSDSNTPVRYVCRYRFSAIGIVYEADADFDGKRARIVRGVITWGIRALPPRKRVEQEVCETIDISDVGKLRERANEA